MAMTAEEIAEALRQAEASEFIADMMRALRDAMPWIQLLYEDGSLPDEWLDAVDDWYGKHAGTAAACAALADDPPAPPPRL